MRRIATRILLLPSFLTLLGFAITPAAPSASSGKPGVTTSQTGAPNAPQPVEEEIAIFGQKIHYLEVGSGPTVILLHGLGGNGQNWTPNLPALAAKFHVLALDQVGFGKSDKPLINYRVATYVDFLDQFCRQLKIDRASLVGESLGGWIAAAFAIAHPEKVDHLVLSDAAGYAPPANFDNRTLYLLNPSTRENMKLLVGKVFYNKAFITDAVIDQVMAERIGAGDGYTINSIIQSVIRGEDFLDNRAQTIKQPTLIVWGREDGLVALSDGQRFKREIPNSTLVVFEQCGHVPNVEKASEFNGAVMKFLTAQ
jgi:2-hydroxy-6-oxonona-2,4-dienedioate hydrolase